MSAPSIPCARATRSPCSRRSPAAERGGHAMIRVQREDFDIGAEPEALSAGNTQIGGVACFVGLVREVGRNAQSSLTLEPYPGITDNNQAQTEAEARAGRPARARIDTSRLGRRE